MSVEKFIADRISKPEQNSGNISKPIVKIGIIGVSVGMCVMLLAVSIILGYKKEIINKITGLTTHITISSINMNASNEPEPIYIGPDSIALIRELPFVKHLQETAFKNGLLKTDTDNEGILLKGVSKNFDFDFLNKHLREGKVLDLSQEFMSKEIMISSSLANKLGLSLGDGLLIYFISQRQIVDELTGKEFVKSEHRSRKLKVCGIFKTDFSDFDDKLGIVDLRQIQRLNYWDSTMVGSYEITVNNFANLDENVIQMQDLLGYDYNVRGVNEIYASIFTWLDKLDLNAIIVVVLMIIVATINMITALLILILERANMVGLVKAVGMSNFSVRKIFLYISLKLVFKGMLWGNIFGIGLCLIQYYFRLIPLPGNTYYIDFIAIEINWLYFLLLNIGTFVTCALMLLLPTLILTKLTPIKTLKFD